MAISDRKTAFAVVPVLWRIDKKNQKQAETRL